MTAIRLLVLRGSALALAMGALYLLTSLVASAAGEPAGEVDQVAAVSVQPDLLLPADTPIAGMGWPFQQLPTVAKREQRLPPPMVVPVALPPFARVTVATREPVPEVVTEGERPSAWLIVPMAALMGGGSVRGTAPAVVPEPAGLLLLATGVGGVLAAAARRRRQSGAFLPAAQGDDQPNG